MEKKTIHSTSAPAAVGTYSQAIRAGGTIYLSGQLGMAPETGAMQTGFGAQAHQMFKNLRAVCEAAGGGLKDVVRLGVYLTDMKDFAQFNAIMAQYFDEPYPARSAVQVAGLPRGGLVEADAIMVLADAATAPGG